MALSKGFLNFLDEWEKNEETTRGGNRPGASAQFQRNTQMQTQVRNPAADRLLRNIGLPTGYESPVNETDIAPFRRDVRALGANINRAQLPSQAKKSWQENLLAYNQLQEKGAQLEAFGNAQDMDTKMDIFRGNYALGGIGDMLDAQKELAQYNSDLDYILKNTDTYERFKLNLSAAKQTGDEQLVSDVYKMGMEREMPVDEKLLKQQEDLSAQQMSIEEQIAANEVLLDAIYAKDEWDENDRRLKEDIEKKNRELVEMQEAGVVQQQKQVEEEIAKQPKTYFEATKEHNRQKAEQYALWAQGNWDTAGTALEGDKDAEELSQALKVNAQKQMTAQEEYDALRMKEEWTEDDSGRNDRERMSQLEKEMAQLVAEEEALYKEAESRAEEAEEEAYALNALNKEQEDVKKQQEVQEKLRPFNELTEMQDYQAKVAEGQQLFVNMDTDPEYQKIKHNTNQGGLLAQWIFGNTDAYAKPSVTDSGRMLIDNETLKTLTQDEMDKIAYLMATDPEKAQEYVDILWESGVVNERINQNVSQMQQEAANENPALATAMSSAATLLAPVGAAYEAVAGLAGQDIDPSSPLFAQNRMIDTTRGTVKQNITEKLGEGTVASFFANIGYDALTSTADSLVSKVFGQMGLPFMAMNAGQNAVMQAKENGASNTEAFMLGGINAMVEYLTEKIPFDEMMKVKDAVVAKEYFQSVLKSGFSDAPGEVIAEVSENLADLVIMGDRSQHAQTVQNYMYNNPDASRAEAERTAWGQEMVAAISAGIAGFFSGATATAVSGAANLGDIAQNANLAGKTGKKKQGENAAFMPRTKAVTMDQVDAAGNVQQDVAEDAQSANLAGKPENAQKKKKNFAFMPRTKRVTMDQVENEQRVQQGKEKAQELRVSETGMTRVEENGKRMYAEIVGIEQKDGQTMVHVQTVNGESVVPADQVEYADKETAERVMVASEVGGEELANTIYNAKAPTEQAYDEYAKEFAAAYTMAKEGATQEEIRASAEAQGLHDAEIRTAVRMAEQNANVDTQEEEMNDSEDMEGAETAYEFGKMGRSQGELESVLKDAGIEMSSAARVSYTRGETARRRAEEARIKEIRELNWGGKTKQRNGVVRSISKAEAENLGVNEITRKMSDKQKAAVKALRGVAQSMGLNIALFDSISKTGNQSRLQGQYDRATGTVYLDINAGKGNEQAMLRTAAHEITHVVQDWNPKKYGELKKYLMEYFYENDETQIQQLVAAQMEKAPTLTEAQALDEVVADACEMMLSDAEAVRNLISKDRSIFEKIREWVDKFIDAIKRATQGVEADSEEAKILQQSRTALEKVREMWMGALEDAGKNLRGTSEESVLSQNGVQTMEGSVVKNSLRTWTEEEKATVRDELVKQGYKARAIDKWMRDVDGIAAAVAADKERLDFKAADNQVMLKPNQEYVKTLDASTLCAKRLIYQGTFDAVQHALPDRVLTSNDLIELRNLLAERGYESPCAVCYVESRRRNLGIFAKEWLDSYQGEYKPHLDDVTTSDGLERLRIEHHDVYKSFVDKMNSKGSNNPKVVQLRTEYRGDIRRMTKGEIKKVLKIGGLRIQSFSDFETPHLLDMMQAVLDMSAKKLTSQAYTKVPNFAAVFGDTGIKINLSLIAEGSGLDKDGNLVFSSREGMDFDRAMELRDMYSKNVGTILVGMSDAHIRAAMADDRIDYIIPFHKSGWGQKQMEQLGISTDADYTDTQNERRIIGYYKNGKPKYKNVTGNFYPIDYWDFTKSGKWNAEKYLDMCAKDGRIPKFDQFLTDNGDGSYSLPKDGSADGYWKLLIDFKMYDNDGRGAPQVEVQPNFNMEEAMRVLGEYEGGADTLPVAHDVVDEFVERLKDTSWIGAPQNSLREEGYQSDRQILANLFDELAETDEQKERLARYKDRIEKIEKLDAQLQEKREAIKEIMFGGGKRDEVRLTKLKQERDKLEGKISGMDRELLQMEHSKPLRQLIYMERKKAEYFAKKKARKSLEKYRESVKRREHQGKIEREAKRLSKWLTQPNNKRLVPESLRGPLAKFLLSIDMRSYTELTTGEKTKKDREYVQTLDTLTDILRNVQQTQDGDTEAQIKELYSGYIDLPKNFVETLTQLVKRAKDAMEEGTFTLQTMSTQELEALDESVSTLSRSLTSINELLTAGSTGTVSETAKASIDYMQGMKERGPSYEFASKLGDYLNWENATPMYAFERYGEGGKKIFRSLQEGQNKLAFNVKKIMEEMTDKDYTSKEARAWAEDMKEIEMPDGRTMRIPVTHIMSLYCLAKREQAQGHIYGGGVLVGEFVHKGKKYRDDTGYLMSPEMVEKITGLLTEKQRNVADKMQRIMNTLGSEWGNYVSVRRFGYKMFTEKNYFPIEVDENRKSARTDDSKGNELYRLLNMSMTKQLTPNASNRLVLKNIFDVYSAHMTDMAQYNALALPALDAVKWLNWQENTVNEYGQISTQSLRDAARYAYGNVANKYIVDLLKDINGVRAMAEGDDKFAMKAVSRYNRAAVAANLRVALLQPLSIVRAGMELPGTSIAKGISKTLKVKDNVKEMMKYSGIAVWKDIGGPEMNVSRSVTEQIKRAESVTDRIVDASMKGAELMDKVTWAAIWQSCKEYVNKRTALEIGSEAYFDEVARKFEDVIYRTQVVDSVLTKSKYMRAGTPMKRMLSAFMSEPTTSYNMLLNAYTKMNASMRRGASFQEAWQKNGQEVMRTVAVYTMSAVLVTMVEQIMTAYRDDDDYETFMEKALDGAAEGLVDNILPTSLLPIFSQLTDIAKTAIGNMTGSGLSGFAQKFAVFAGYDTVNEGLALINDWRTGNLKGYTPYGAVYKTLSGLSSVTGIPVAPAMREVVALVNNTYGYITGNRIQTYRTSKTAGYQALFGAIERGDDERAAEIRTELGSNNTTDKQITSGLTTQAKNAYLSGDMTAEEATDFLMKYGKLTKDKAYFKLQEWGFENESDDDYSVYMALEEAVKTGTGVEDAAKELTEHGYTQSQVNSKVREFVKEAYLDGEMQKAQAESMLKKHGGLDANETYFKMLQYDYEDMTGESTSSDACMIYYAIDNKQSPKNAIDDALKHGKQKSGLASSITSHYKEEYLKLAKTDVRAAAALKGRLITVFDYLGYKGKEKVEGWEK